MPCNSYMRIFWAWSILQFVKRWLKELSFEHHSRAIEWCQRDVLKRIVSVDETWLMTSKPKLNHPSWSCQQSQDPESTQSSVKFECFATVSFDYNDVMPRELPEYCTVYKRYYLEVMIFFASSNSKKGSDMRNNYS